MMTKENPAASGIRVLTLALRFELDPFLQHGPDLTPGVLQPLHEALASRALLKMVFDIRTFGPRKVVQSVSEKTHLIKAVWIDADAPAVRGKAGLVPWSKATIVASKAQHDLYRGHE